MEIQRSELYIAEMCCADDQAIIEKKLRYLKGIEEYHFNLIARKLHLRHSSGIEGIIQGLGEIGFVARPVRRTADPPAGFFQQHFSAILTSVAAMAAVAGIILSSAGVREEISISFYAFAIAVGGWKIARKGWLAAKALSLDMNFLMSAAVAGAMIIGKWEEGAAVVVLFAIAQVLEEYSLARTRRTISLLLEAAPSTATVRRHSFEVDVRVEDIAVNDVVIIRPGERIPVDGDVVKGHSFVNQSAITGESAPVEKSTGSQVYAGSLNERGSLEIRTGRAGEDTTLARIIHLVEEAQAQRSPSQDLVDRFARVYTPIVLLLSLSIALFPPLFFHQPFGGWFYRSLVLLVIACPCALVISTPVTIVSGLTMLARRGILVKGGRYLEELSKVRALAFDKTGTVTVGIPIVTDILTLNSTPAKEVLRIAALGEMNSEHALAQAVILKAKEENLEFTQSVDHFESITGKGIAMMVEGEEYVVGNHQLIEERGLCSPEIEASLVKLESQGKTTMIIGTKKMALGIIAVADSVRKESHRAIQELKRIGIEKILILSGDSSTVTRSIANSLKIDEAYAELLPQDKVEKVKALKVQYGSVGMIGDGINDAPALAASSVGISMGMSGTGAAIETADVVLMKDDLLKTSEMISLSRKSISLLQQNITIALVAKFIFLLMGIGGLATLWMAVVADDGVTLLVVFNSLRLLRLSRK